MSFAQQRHQLPNLPLCHLSPGECKFRMLDCLTSVCANFAARPVFHHGAPCVAAANGARRSLPMASRACVSPSASLRLPLPHGCQDIFTDTRSACLSGFQGSIPLRAQTAKGGTIFSHTWQTPQALVRSVPVRACPTTDGITPDGVTTNTRADRGDMRDYRLFWRAWMSLWVPLTRIRSPAPKA